MKTIVGYDFYLLIVENIKTKDKIPGEHKGEEGIFVVNG